TLPVGLGSPLWNCTLPPKVAFPPVPAESMKPPRLTVPGVGDMMSAIFATKASRGPTKGGGGGVAPAFRVGFSTVQGAVQPAVKPPPCVAPATEAAAAASTAMPTPPAVGHPPR